jgi:hypothetical protein
VINVSCAIVTRTPNSGGVVRREPLSRLRLPASLSLDWNTHGSSRVWWIESDGHRQFLRALCHVRAAEGDRHALAVGTQFVLPVDRFASERITWSEGPTYRQAEVGGRFSSLGIYPVDVSIGAALEHTRQSAASPTSGLRGAQRRVSELLRRTILKRHPILSSTPTFAEALDYARSYFARAELPHVDGVDPFELVAHVMRGTSPAELVSSGEGMRSFAPIEPTSLQIAAWHSSEGHRSLEALEASRRKHQLIVGELKDVLARRGLRPCCNVYVDTAVLTPQLDLLFEVKTATAENLLEQLRCAVAQLFEYRFRIQLGDRRRRVGLVVVIEAPTDSLDMPFAQSFLASLGVELVSWRGEGRFDGLTDALQATLGAALAVSV